MRGGKVREYHNIYFLLILFLKKFIIVSLTELKINVEKEINENI